MVYNACKLRREAISVPWKPAKMINVSYLAYLN